MPGDNYYHAFPNLYTIRGTSPRPVDAWIDSLDQMRRRAPEHLVPSHTIPLRGRENILGALTRYRDAIQWVRDRVVAGANAGMRLEPLVESIGLPPAVASDPALAPLYGQVDWSARAIYTNHLGWFDGSPEALYPMPERDQAARTVAMMGGAERLWTAIDGSARTDPRWALHLLTLLRNSGLAVETPGERWALTSATALESLAATVGNSNGRGYLLESALGLRHGAPPLPTPRASAAILDAVPMATVFHVMASRLLPELSAGVHESVRFDLTDSHETFFLTIRNGVLEVAKTASSVSRCISSLYFSLTRTSTSPNTRSRGPSESTATSTSSPSVTPKRSASSGCMWMCRRRADQPLGELQRALGPLERDGRRASRVTRLADRRIDAELELVGARDLHLTALAQRSEHAHALEAAAGPDHGHALLGRVLPRL